VKQIATTYEDEYNDSVDTMVAQRSSVTTNCVFKPNLL